MKNFIYVIVFLLAIAFYRCNKKTTHADMSMNLEIIQINADNAKQEIAMSDVFSSIEYIPLESRNGHLIGEISKLLIYKKHIFIMDNLHTQSIFCFTETGNFLYEINRQGQGPGEYSKLIDFNIDYEQDRLLLFSTYKVLEFDLGGQFLSEHKVDFIANSSAYIGNGCQAFYGDYTENSKFENKGYTPNLLILKNNKTIYTDLYFPSEIQSSSLESTVYNFSDNSRGTVLLFEPYNDTLYHLTPDLVERRYYIDFGKNKKDKNFYSLLYSPSSSLKDVKTHMMNQDICNIIAVSETETCLFFIYSCKTVYHLVFYNKKTNEIKDCFKDYRNENDVTYPVKNDIDGSLVAMPFFTDGDSFYGCAEAYLLKQSAQSVTDTVLKQKLDNLLEDDNPVIIKMILKQ
ncbi:MAG: 6-bladed beta-propeller [Dysgonamonadaceae bacterium]|nr:6-bladed beta-propeller [Dysgonamonadaceae bacterium]